VGEVLKLKYLDSYEILLEAILIFNLYLAFLDILIIEDDIEMVVKIIRHIGSIRSRSNFNIIIALEL